MEITYITFLIITPFVLFFTAFFISRQFRAMENVPTISVWFIQRKLLISVVWGLLMSGLSSFAVFLKEPFSARTVFGFLILFLVSYASFYFGITFGWGKPTLDNSEFHPLVSSNSISALPNNITVEDTFNSIKISISNQKRWAYFLMSLFQWIMMSLCGLPILGLLLFSISQKYFPQGINILIWVIIGGLVLYLIYIKFREMLEYLDDKEIIEIDNLSVRIETSGSGFTSKKEFSAENITKITGMLSLGAGVTAIRRSRFLNANFPAFMLWYNRGLKRYHSFGRAIDAADAQRILENIYSKFPQYKG